MPENARFCATGSRRVSIRRRAEIDAQIAGRLLAQAEDAARLLAEGGDASRIDVESDRVSGGSFDL